MADVIGGAGVIGEGKRRLAKLLGLEEGSEDWVLLMARNGVSPWYCKNAAGCNGLAAPHGYSYRDRYNRLEVTRLGVHFDGDGYYRCPVCGKRINWELSVVGMSRIMANKTGVREEK